MSPLPPLEITLVVFGAVAMDLALGDPRSRYHPTAWAGRLIAAVVTRFAGRGFWAERLGGAAAVVVTAGAAVAALLLLHHAIWYPGSAAAASAAAYPGPHHHLAPAIASVLAGCVLLKCTIAIRGMQRHACAVVDPLKNEDGGAMGAARASLAMIVKRKTGSLDREHVISGVLESIGENTVDGVTGPLFYYGLLGLPGAFIHRIVSTADSMVGYRSRMLGRLGWFAAHGDTVLNYLPARLTGLAMVGASAMLGYDWRCACRTMVRDHGKTESPNSGYAMAALAGALNVRLEKEGHYTLGGEGSAPDLCDVDRAVSLMRMTALVFAAGVAVPLGLATVTVVGVVFGGVMPTWWW